MKKNLVTCQERIADEFLDKLVKWTKNIKISDPFEEGCRLGPVVSKGQVILLNRIDILKNQHLDPSKPLIYQFGLITKISSQVLYLNPMQYERVLKFVSNARNEGATVLCGGSRPEVHYRYRLIFYVCPNTI